MKNRKPLDRTVLYGFYGLLIGILLSVLAAQKIADPLAVPPISMMLVLGCGIVGGLVGFASYRNSNE